MKSISKLKIVKPVFGGYGLGFWEGQSVFVPSALPGDVIDVRVKYTKKKSIFAEIEKYHEHSKDYVQPECSSFPNCGGCNWANLAYNTQIDYKTTIIRELFRDIDFTVESVTPSPVEKCYRNKSFMPVGGTTSAPLIGMFEGQTHNVIEHEECLLHPNIYNEVVDVVKRYIVSAKVKIYDEEKQMGQIRHVGVRYSKQTDEMLVVLVTKSGKLPFTKQLVSLLTEKFPQIKGIIQNINSSIGNKILGNKDKILFGVPFLKERLLNKLFRVNYKSFFQVNTKQAEQMLQFVAEYLTKNSIIIDAYCGTGSIGIALSDYCSRVIGIETVAEAVEDARNNAKLNNLTNCDYYCGEVEAILPELLKKVTPDTIIFDPPRKGMTSSIIEATSNLGIRRVIYVSCNPSTQHRDLKQFITNGYRILAIQPFDMFPYTWHIENIVILEKQ